jgi:hypothetical protein
MDSDFPLYARVIQGRVCQWPMADVASIPERQTRIGISDAMERVNANANPCNERWLFDPPRPSHDCQRIKEGPN